MRVKHIAICAASALMLMTGCSTSKINLQEVTDAYYGGNFKKAYELAQEGANIGRAQDEKAQGDELLYQFTGGVIGFDLGTQQATQFLARADENFMKISNEGVLTSMFQDLAATAVNDTILPYSGYLYEGTMISYYQALNAMASKNDDETIRFFNIAQKRQEQIEEYYAGQISGAKALITNLQKTAKMDSKEKEPAFEVNPEFEAFKGYINPMVDYVSGLVFMLNNKQQSDVEYFLKKAYGISKADVINQDMELLKSETLNKGSDKYTWIIIEDGKSPSKGEATFQFPIFTGESFSKFALAYPTFKSGVAFSNSYSIAQGDVKTNASRIASLDPLFYNEFKLQYPFVVTRAILGATLKALAQYAIQKSSGSAGKAFSSLSVLKGEDSNTQSAKADLRISTVLPNGFYAVRVKNTDGVLKLQNDKGVTIYQAQMSQECTGKDTLCSSKNNIVYVRNVGKAVISHILMSK